MKRYKTPEEFITDQDMWSTELTTLREILLDTGLKEEIKWGFPVYTLKGKNIAGLGAFKAYFGIWFFQGALLNDDANKLVNAQEGKTVAMRQWRMNSADEIDHDLIHTYLEEAIENQKAGKEIKPVRKKPELIMPAQLQQALDNNPAASRAFSNLTPYKQREYAEYRETAKREATKVSRLQKILPMIEEGKGLSDQYR